MNPAIKIVVDSERGCGWRNEGGLYIRSEALNATCGKLPVPLHICPACGEGIRQSRAPRMVENPSLLWQHLVCKRENDHICQICPLNKIHMDKALIIWIGATAYPTPYDFLSEARLLGVSRRIPSIPQGFEIGTTHVLFAHAKGITHIELGQEPTFTPAIIAVVCPDRIEYVVKGDETDEEIQKLVNRGITPVLVKKDIDTIQQGVLLET